ncbi:hypothetical protein PI125_g21139 [Phytophthora idaei]|nr:hypothetical protein PI125_g21139 [Phytophthora idaei]
MEMITPVVRATSATTPRVVVTNDTGGATEDEVDPDKYHDDAA